MSQIMDPATGEPIATQPRALSRDALDAPAAPVRIVHLGIGAFHRAHQAYYTDLANALGGDQWGIAAFTGRSPGEARKLESQDGLYVLVTRAADGDASRLIRSLSSVHDGADFGAWLGYLADPAVTALTITVTEAGYRCTPGGELDLRDPEVVLDVDALVAGDTVALRTAPGRIVQGLRARMAAGAGPILVISCDNLPENGVLVQRVVLQLGRLVSPALAAWIERNVRFPNTMVDRITPRTTPSDVADVRVLGWDDSSPVITEPFMEWVIEGGADDGLPPWALAGAVIVPDVGPFERRKLTLVNGGHSLLALLGGVRGHATVADAVADPVCERWLTDWWDEAAPDLPFPEDELAEYRSALLTRFANPRILHQLAQIGADSSLKLPGRVGPVLVARRAEGLMPYAGALIVAAWLAVLRGHGRFAGPDPRLDEALVIAAKGELRRGARAVVAHVAPSLADDEGLIDVVLGQFAALGVER